MQVIVLLCVMISVADSEDTWRLKARTSEWNYETVHRHLDVSNMVESIYSKSLIGCATFCSNVVSTVIPSLYFIPATGQCACNAAVDGTSENENEPELVYGTRKTLKQIELTDSPDTRTTVWPYQPDCSSLYDSSYHQDGVYVINPSGDYLTDTWCDMVNGGWTVIQRRMDGSENFNRDWDDYVNGFGNNTGEFWLGLDNMHHLTITGSELHIYMEGYPGVTPRTMTASYMNFTIGNSASEYRLTVSGFNGTCGDSLNVQNRQSFTTFDNDNDEYNQNCAIVYAGGWWHNACHESHLNGLYFQEGAYLNTASWGSGIHWHTCWGRSQSSKLAIMKIKSHS